MNLVKDVSYQSIRNELQTFRKNNPLIHCITNEVVQEITANVLLAAGASPAMVVGDGEVVDFVRAASALSINVGTPTTERVEIMKMAAKAAVEFHKPWVLDPVAAGGMKWRDKIIFDLLDLSPSAVRGNASEIRFLAGIGKGGKGVDSTDSSESALEAAVQLAQKYSTVVAVTGETDFVTDGSKILRAQGGNVMITKVVGTGCSLSSLMSGFIANNTEAVTSCAACCAYVKKASELAAARSTGPGSFHDNYLDSLYILEPNHWQ